MTNEQLFIKENPTVEIKINGSCVWIYFDGVNHYTMPVKWWDKEIGLCEDIKAEIKEWYWQADKQAIAKDPCVVDAMIDLFIRTIDKHIGKERMNI